MSRTIAKALLAGLLCSIVACAPSAEPASAAAATPAAAVSGLKVQYHTAATGSATNQLAPLLAIVNTGSSSVTLSDLTVRYWYTKDGTQSQNYYCDYTPRGCTNVTARFVAMSATASKADTYLELGFTSGAGTLSTGASTGDIQSRVAKSDWSSYDQPGDYSFDATKSSTPADWDRVTLYQGGVLIWGVEPGGSQTVDTQAPTMPANLVSSGVTSSSVSLAWTASTDNVGVIGYDVYSGSTGLTSSITTSASVTGLAASTTYTFTVRARDAAGNLSSSSNAVTVTTQAQTTTDTQRPTAPTNLATSGITSSGATLTWTASTDNVGVVGYDVLSGSTRLTSTTTNRATLSGLAASTTYTLIVVARDAAGNVSASSNAVTFTTQPQTTTDTQRPTAPTNLAASGITSSGATLTWTASTDNVGVAGYDVYSGSTRLASTTTATATVAGLAASTTYTLTVVARDAAGNVSPSSNGVTFTTLAASQFQLLWQDDFNSFDNSRWQLMTHTWDGNLAQFSTANTRFQNGILSLLLTRAPSDTAKPFRGVEMRSLSTLTYGKIETRARYAKGSGVVSGTVLIYTPWPADNWNELDIEFLGAYTDRVQFNAMVYTGAPVTPPVTVSVTPTQFPQTVSLGFDGTADFHVYGVEWTPAGVKYTIDGVTKATWSSEIARMKLPQNILLTIWASNSAGWAGPILSSTAPTQADFDWIKVYRYTP